LALAQTQSTGNEQMDMQLGFTTGRQFAAEEVPLYICVCIIYADIYIYIYAVNYTHTRHTHTHTHTHTNMQ
jgi:hypothetical protein